MRREEERREEKRREDKRREEKTREEKRREEIRREEKKREERQYLFKGNRMMILVSNFIDLLQFCTYYNLPYIFLHIRQYFKIWQMS